MVEQSEEKGRLTVALAGEVFAVGCDASSSSSSATSSGPSSSTGGGGAKPRSAIAAVAFLPCLLCDCVGLAGIAAVLLWRFWGDSSDGSGGAAAPRSGFMECRLDPSVNWTELSLDETTAGRNDAEYDCCNGLPTICDLPLSDVTFATSHNAMASAMDGFLAPNHLYPLEESLEAGYRAFMLDSCSCDGGVALCHGLCESGTRDPAEVFANLASFLRENPSEVILLEFQIQDDTLFRLYDVMNSTPGFVDMMYFHSVGGGGWPTMRELVRSDRRLVVFQHNGGNCLQAWPVEGSCPPGVHDTFRFMFETPFGNTVNDFLVDPFSGTVKTECTIHRGSAGYRDFYILNHFAGYIAGIPDLTVSNLINERDVVEGRMDACAAVAGGKAPNLVAVDFWSEGGVPSVVQDRNMAMAELRAAQAAEMKAREGGG